MVLPPLLLLEGIADGPGRAGPDLTRYVVVCALLLLALGGAAWFLRRAVGGVARAGAARRSLQVVDVLPLGGKQRVCVVRCYDRTFALGVGEKEIGLIAEIDAAVSVGAAPAAPRAISFQDVLARLRGGSRAEREEVLS
jgi:flagellar biosynthetic protein FliO